MVIDNRSTQRPQELLERLLFTRCQTERSYLIVQPGIRLGASVVKLNHVGERRKASVVHVRSGARNLSERGRFERATVAEFTGNGRASFIGRRATAPRNPGVV